MNVITHSGIFQAGDLLGAAILSLAFESDDIKITRSRNSEELANADILFGVGGKYDPKNRKFDNESPDPVCRKNGVTHTAASLLWKEYGEKVIREVLIANGYADDPFYRNYINSCWKYIAGHIDFELFIPLDVEDTGEGRYILVNRSFSNSAFPLAGSDTPNKHTVMKYAHPQNSAYTLSTYLQNLNCAWWEDATPATQEERFYEGVSIAAELLESVVEDSFWFQKGRRIVIDGVLDAAKGGTPKVLVLDRYIPFKAHLFAEGLENTDVQFIIWPSQDPDNQQWKLAGAPPAKNNLHAVKILFPAMWGGFSGEKLQQISNCNDIIFCNANLKIAAFNTKEAALKVATDLINHERINDRVDLSQTGQPTLNVD